MARSHAPQAEDAQEVLRQRTLAKALVVGNAVEGTLTFLDWHPPDERRRRTYDAFAR